uniref:Envelope fusion protein n=2 Tax=Lygus hesperus TaxID=30085 RepID=A0A0A9YE18_LYGHE
MQTWLTLLLLSATHAATIKNLENSGGLLPIELETTYLENAEHSLVHYYDLESIYSEYLVLGESFDKYKYTVKRYPKLQEKLDEYLLFLEQGFNKVYVRFQNIVPKLNKRNRTKRGLINGLGTIVKAITGNLDDDDRQKYEQILEQLKNKNTVLEGQVNSQYSLTKSLIDHYNKTLSNLKFNNEQIKEKLQAINQVLNPMDATATVLKDNIHHMQLTLNVLDYTLGEIETAYTFCKIGQLHPSIISTADLKAEIDLVLNKTQTSTLEMFENIMEYETLIRTDCILEDKRIIFLLNLPLYSKKKYYLYTLKPIPLRKGEDYIAIIPQNNYYLYDKDEEFYTLKELCKKVNNKYFCNWDALCKVNARCEKTLIMQNSVKDCQYSKFEIQKPLIQKFQEINQLLITAPNEVMLEIRRKDQSELTKLSGSYLIKTEGDEIYLNKELILSQGSSSGKPLFLQVELNEVPEINLANETFKLENYDDFYIDNNHSWVNYSPDFRTIPMIIDVIVVSVIVVILLYLILPKLFKYRAILKISRGKCSQEPNSQETSSGTSEGHIPATTIPIRIPRGARK